MSDPKEQRADGCSVFFSILLGLLFVCSFFIIQKFFNFSDETSEDMISSERKKKISSYSNDSELFKSKVDSFYSDKNFSLESSMNETVRKYKSDPQNKTD